MDKKLEFYIYKFNLWTQIWCRGFRRQISLVRNAIKCKLAWLEMQRPLYLWGIVLDSLRFYNFSLVVINVYAIWTNCKLAWSGIVMEGYSLKLTWLYIYNYVLFFRLVWLGNNRNSTDNFSDISNRKFLFKLEFHWYIYI